MSVAAADAYLDVVQPMLVRRCGGCHNSDKLESGFNVATYESTLKGGDSGRVIQPGKSDSSELYRRISLDPDDEEFMPAEHKTPLTVAQVEIVRWWIDGGAPHGVTVGETKVEPAVDADRRPARPRRRGGARERGDVAAERTRIPPSSSGCTRRGFSCGRYRKPTRDWQ